MALKTSNENIIFLYLQLKKDIISLDRRLKELDVFVDKKRKQVENGTSELGNDPRAELVQKLISALNPGAEPLDVKGMILKELENFEKDTRNIIEGNLKWRAGILKDMQTAFDVLKEEMPEEVEKVEKLIKDTPDF